MAGRDTKYYIESKQNALQIPDVRTAMEVLRLLGVNARGRGIRTKDDAIGIIIQELEKGVSIGQIKTKEPCKGLKKAIEDDNNNIQKLLTKYDAVQKLFSELPPKYKKDLNQVFPGIENEFETRKNEIKRSECTILVAGETASGKSSLINLLLGGTDLFPTSQLGCTATICEIRTNYQGRKEAIGYYRSAMTGDRKKGKKPPPVMFDLSCESGLQKFQTAVSESDEDGDSPFERFEVTWPFPMLEEGIVIVDTPGIGGGGNMAKYAEKYLSKSYGFIYVINSANAGGVQKGRLQNFMRLVTNSAGEEGFDSESTMFVCNRWDMVPEKDREAVKRDTFEKLSRYYSHLKRSQVHYMSMLEAKKGISYGTMTQEYTQLMDLVEQLMPTSLRSRLNTHYRWLTAVLKRMIYSLKVSKVMAAKSMEKVKDELQQIKNQIAKLEQNSKESINYLKSNISHESEIVAKTVVEALQSRQMAERLFNWKPNECPREGGKKIAADALEAITNKIALEMNFWEREKQVVTGIKDKIIRVCKRDFELMENQIAKLEGALLDGDMKTVQDLHKSIKKQAPPNKIWRKAKEASIDEDSGSFKGLGGAVSSVCSLKPGDKLIKKIFSDYKSRDPNKCIAKMQDATKLVLDNIVESKHLLDKVHTFFKRFVKGIDAVAKMIPDFLKADLELMEMLRDEMSDAENNLKDLFPRLLHTSYMLLGQLDLFYVNYIMVFDFQLEDIIWDHGEAPVGSGSFADVYIAELKTNRRGKAPVALKVNRDPLKENTISDILLEDRTMRELDNRNVVQYYGATYRFKDEKRKKDMQWIMLMEVCKYTLKQKFISPEFENPGKPIPGDLQKKSMMMMSDFALQLCSGLKYLHQKGFVHRDLKLENVLVTEDNVVKLTDVGLAKQGQQIAYSVVGSPVYMAPEVLLQSQNYDHKADIYSVGIMLWEMWYGKDAADYIQHQLFGPLDKAIKEGLRPSLKITCKPPNAFASLIEAAWQYEPEKRPNADVLCKFFEEFLRDSRRN
ncbi:uncharacterized protein LOC123529922 [Mercenaria mercenaria]|uniref:uncharacterized protein LOC123529922 n=1 Tax=Mercenaria mercenaria TaxID=6596 RepID=UPI00234E7101|nr:uncharacterized protein LOC123529922 [Mercenaria mercenaria]XP_045166453.2 uncharacterized protein LOC123529922 [Mercenaria mercenaria]